MPATALVHQMAARARVASRQLATLSGAQKNLALHRIADALLAHQAKLIEENAKDIDQAKKDGLAAHLIAAPNTAFYPCPQSSYTSL